MSLSPASIEEIVALVLQLGPLAVDLLVKMESLFNIGPDEKTNIANAILASNNADEDTIARVKAWQSANPGD